MLIPQARGSKRLPDLGFTEHEGAPVLSWYYMIFCGKFFSRDLKGSGNENKSDVEEGSNSKSLEILSDSELSLDDEPLMEVQVSKVS